ncbi:unnamed protein product [Symbiodinium necroappetens]|uniref:Uncharacterized protein n=1 Tax=Symbiodinium necroappetens TaxID=1628268 RepID=A0A812SD77_9DINO|nr:unnamed protein product [Symbiodinium necroappetens]
MLYICSQFFLTLRHEASPQRLQRPIGVLLRASSSDSKKTEQQTTASPQHHFRDLYEGSARQMHTQMERLAKMTRNVQLSYRVMMAGGGAVAVGIGYVVINWTILRSHVSQESAEVVSQTMRDAQVQFTAREFSKELLNQLLHDEEIATTVASWTLRLLASIQEEIGALFVRILQQDQVVDEVNRLADKLVAYLCASQQIQDWMCFHIRVSSSQSSDSRRGAQHVKLQLSAREAWIRG